MDVFDTGILAKSQTTYRNILETLGGTMVVGLSLIHISLHRCSCAA